MESSTSYTLGKNERLKSRKAIELLFANAKSFSVFPFKVIYQQLPDSEIPLKAAFSVSKRYFKKAVHRNRIKRLMRETYRLQKNELQNGLQLNGKSVAVFFIYLDKALPEYALVELKMKLVLAKLKKQLDETTVHHT